MTDQPTKNEAAAALGRLNRGKKKTLSKAFLTAQLERSMKPRRPTATLEVQWFLTGPDGEMSAHDTAAEARKAAVEKGWKVRR